MKAMDLISIDELRMSGALVIARTLLKNFKGNLTPLALEIVAVYNKHGRLRDEYGRKGGVGLAATLRAGMAATMALTVEERVLLGLVYSEFLTDRYESDAALLTASEKAQLLRQALEIDHEALTAEVDRLLGQG